MKSLQSYDQRLESLTAERVRLAKKYADQRKIYGMRKAELDVLLAGKILSLVEKKKNIGYEVAVLMAMADEKDGKTFADIHKEMTTSYNNFKAIERMLDALESQIMSVQSIMKWNLDGERKEST